MKPPKHTQTKTQTQTQTHTQHTHTHTHKQTKGPSPRHGTGEHQYCFWLFESMTPIKHLSLFTLLKQKDFTLIEFSKYLHKQGAQAVGSSFFKSQNFNDWVAQSQN